jgi:hypothetical protein
MNTVEEKVSEPSLLPGLTEGRIVHYVLSDGRSKGQHRPAIVVQDWKQENGSVNLQVFTDGSNDYLGKGQDGTWCFTLWKTSVHYSEEPKPGTWHWPEKA